VWKQVFVIEVVSKEEVDTPMDIGEFERKVENTNILRKRLLID
jgi:hypothetical protein